MKASAASISMVLISMAICLPVAALANEEKPTEEQEEVQAEHEAAKVTDLDALVGLELPADPEGETPQGKRVSAARETALSQVVGRVPDGWSVLPSGERQRWEIAGYKVEVPVYRLTRPAADRYLKDPGVSACLEQMQDDLAKQSAWAMAVASALRKAARPPDLPEGPGIASRKGGESPSR